MKIRSITCFINPGWPLDKAALRNAGLFIAEARAAFEAAGYEVQTTRLATIPFPRLLGAQELSRIGALAQELEGIARAQGFEYLALGPALPEFPQSYELIPEILAETENVFAAGVMADGRHGVSLPAVRACARVIQETALIDPHGFGNLYFAALANVPPGCPFFPAAYQVGDSPAFALATEAADLAVEAFEGQASLEAARGRLTAQIQGQAAALTRVGRELESRHADGFEGGLRFGGIDFSLAPYPNPAISLGTAMERMGVPAVGLHGSLAAAALLTDAVDRAEFPRAGFNGLFLPLLEDSTLASRAVQGRLSVKDLLLYSAVCGTGLDTLPLPGDVSAEALTGVLLDLAALSERLKKPLTARLMPIPGKEAGDLTGFDFEYFAQSRILALQAEPLRALLAGDESFQLKKGEH